MSEQLVASSPISVLIVIGSLDVGGAERHLAQVLPRLARFRVRVTVCVLTHRGVLAEALEIAGVQVLEPPWSRLICRLPPLLRNVIGLPLNVFRLWIVLLRMRPDVVHFFLPAAYLIGASCSLLAAPSIRVMSRRSLDHYQRNHPVLARVERKLHPMMDAILGNSRAVTAQLLAEGVQPGRVGVLYNGVEPVSIGNRSSRLQVRASLGIPSDCLVVTLLANLIPYKGHADLLVALSRISERLPSPWVTLWVGYDMGCSRALLERARVLGIAGHVNWLGCRHDVADILRASDIGLICSHQEGFSNSLLEGMAAGLAMVVTDVGGNREAVADGHCGVLVPAHHPIALGDAILQLAEDCELRAILGDRARKRALEDFSVEECVTGYARLYRGLTAGDPRSVPEILIG